MTVEVVTEESKFDKLKNKIKSREGYSEKGAEGAAADIGRAKYGKKGMAKKSAAGKAKHESLETSQHNTLVTEEEKDWDSMPNEAKDLVLFADQDKELKHDSKHPILQTLAKKKARGEYDPDDAVNLWNYHADRAAVKCCKIHGEPDQVWHKMFKTSHRKAAAKHWEALHRGQLDHINEAILMEAELAQEDTNQIYSLLKSAVENKPADFKETFTDILNKKIVDAVDGYKDEVKKFMFNHINGIDQEYGVTLAPLATEDEEINEVSKQLLGRYIKQRKVEAGKEKEKIDGYIYPDNSVHAGI